MKTTRILIIVIVAFVAGWFARPYLFKALAPEKSSGESIAVADGQSLVTIDNASAITGLGHHDDGLVHFMTKSTIPESFPWTPHGRQVSEESGRFQT